MTLYQVLAAIDDRMNQLVDKCEQCYDEASIQYWSAAHSELNDLRTFIENQMGSSTDPQTEGKNK